MSHGLDEPGRPNVLSTEKQTFSTAHHTRLPAAGKAIVNARPLTALGKASPTGDFPLLQRSLAQSDFHLMPSATGMPRVMVRPFLGRRG